MLKIAGKEENMEQLLSEIYEKVVYASENYNRLNQMFDSEVEEMICPLKDRLTAEELDELRSLIYNASYTAEKNGFYLGVHTAVQFFKEAVNIGEA